MGLLTVANYFLTVNSQEDPDQRKILAAFWKVPYQNR